MILIKKIFWNKSNNNYIPLLSWDRICTPKSEGGLGIHKAEDLNNALQMKLLWKLLFDKDNIWVRIITEKYLKEENILHYNDKKAKSWQFGRLLHLRNIFQTAIGWEVADGK